MARRRLIAGNWKMNGLSASLAELEAMIAGLEAAGGAVDAALCPPATLLGAFAAAAAAKGSALGLGGQDCHTAVSGAHTGDLSAQMLADLKAGYCILGHSERRAGYGESDALVKAKAEAALSAGLIAIVCVGETEADRDAGRALAVVSDQLAGSLPSGASAANLVIAYEPVWAIGTGRTPTVGDIAEMHDQMRADLARHIGAEAEGVRLLYGGSVKPGNAAEIFGASNVDGALVGGASLKAADFLGIIAAAG